MKMNDIRGDYGAEFIETFTNEFVKGIGAKLFHEKEVREEIQKVRICNYEPPSSWRYFSLSFNCLNRNIKQASLSMSRQWALPSPS
ncbi:hypothetical protein R75483_07601 [Paraburkholderia domus]|nr:hypothetical protein R75483_07601 [Paraburkholderia domus]